MILLGVFAIARMAFLGLSPDLSLCCECAGSSWLQFCNWLRHVSPGHLSNWPEHECCQQAPRQLSGRNLMKKPWATSDRIQRGFSRHLSMTPKKEIPQQKRKPISKHTCKTGGLVRFVWCFAQSAWERVTWFSQLLDSDSARKRWSNETRKSNSS